MSRHAWILALLSAGCATLEPPPPDTSGQVRVAEDALFYETFGDRTGAKGVREVVVLVHGGGVDRRVWDAQVEALSERYFVVRYDRRGYGRSSLPAQAYSDTADLVSMLEQLQVTSAHLVASSAGAAVALDLALEQPDRVRSLTLVGATLDGYRYSGHETQLVDAIFRTAQTSGTDAAIERWIEKPGMFATDDHESDGPRKLRELLRENRQVFTFPWNLRERTTRIVPQLPAVPLPTLVVCGKQDTPDNRVLSDLLADRIPTSTLAIIDEAGHMVHLEQPGQFNETLLGFLRKHRDRGRD